VLRLNPATDEGTQTKAKHPEEYAPKDRIPGNAGIGAYASAALLIRSRTHDEPGNHPRGKSNPRPLAALGPFSSAALEARKGTKGVGGNCQAIWGRNASPQSHGIAGKFAELPDYPSLVGTRGFDTNSPPNITCCKTLRSRAGATNQKGE
jgi:hypothetical protein